MKRAIETREEMGDFIRAFSVSQFSKHYTTPEVCSVFINAVFIIFLGITDLVLVCLYICKSFHSIVCGTNSNRSIINLFVA